MDEYAEAFETAGEYTFMLVDGVSYLRPMGVELAR
jgi:hypothetical protein